jgi:DNA invertase Pin-like site-specific DNA recombinase
MNKLAVAYYRVSTRKQADQRQEYSVKEHFNKEGFEIVEVFRETISGAKKNKPELHNALDYIDKHQIKYLVASELNRIGRTNEVISIIDTLTEKGVCVCLQKENIKTLNDDMTENQTSSLLINFLTGMAKNELHTIKFRMIDGRQNAVLNKHHYSGGGRGVYGYDVIEKFLVINEYEAGIVRDIFNKYIQGYGTVKIANDLNNNNVPTKLNSLHQKKEVKFTTTDFLPTKWSRSQVLQILKNRLYTGERKFKEFPPFRQEELRIISDDTYDMVQMKKEEKRQVNGEYDLKRKYIYLLGNKIMKCGCCNRHYGGVMQRNIYICLQNKYSKICENDNLNLTKFDKFITDFIVTNYKNLMFDNDSIRTKINNWEAEKKQNEIQQHEAENKREKYTEMYAMGVLKKEAMQKKVYKCDDDIEALEENIIKLSELITKERLQLLENSLAQINLSKDYETGEAIIDNTTIRRLIKQIVIHKKDNENKRNIKVIMINNEEHNLTYKQIK